MAKTKYFLPLTDELRLTWFENFYLKLITSYVLTFALTTVQTDALLADLKAMRYSNQLVDAVAQFALACTAYRKAMTKGVLHVITPAFPVFVAPLLPPTAVQPGIFVRIRQLVKLLKANTNFNSVIELDLGMIGATINIDFSTFRPVLTVSTNGPNILIKSPKLGTNSINLYSKRGTEIEFSFLATISNASYIDMRANLVVGMPETRNYQAWYVVGDQEIGLISAVQTITIGSDM